MKCDYSDSAEQLQGLCQLANLHSGQLFHPNNNSNGRFSKAATPERFSATCAPYWLPKPNLKEAWFKIYHYEFLDAPGESSKDKLLSSDWWYHIVRTPWSMLPCGKHLYVQTTFLQRQRHAPSHGVPLPQRRASRGPPLPARRTYQAALPFLTVMLRSTWVACDGTCSMDANLIICLWCAHPLAVCSATPCSANSSYVDLAIFDSGTACTHVIRVIWGQDRAAANSTNPPWSKWSPYSGNS